MVYLLSVLIFAGLLLGLAGVLTVAEKLLVNYGICQVDIRVASGSFDEVARRGNAGQRAFKAEGGQTLLSALYGEQVFIPSACGGRGSCGHCRIAVLSGGGAVLPTETPYLTRKEIRTGVRLACQVKVREDVRVRIPRDLLNARRFSATVESTRSLTHDIKEIRLALGGPPRILHRPGQYVQVQVPSLDGPAFRAYSISSPVHEPNVVELVVRLVPGGVGSTYLHELKAGDGVSFTGPFGEFRLDEDPSVEVVCVGGGCGMAPIRNIICSLYDRWPERSCWLFFGCRTTRDVFYLDEFRELASVRPSFRVVYALSGPVESEEEWDGEVGTTPLSPPRGGPPEERTFRETGFIHLSADKYLEPGVRRQAFLCGPPPMVEAVNQVLRGKGLRSEDIFYDSFQVAAAT